jgi:23S rRNA pseudouridine1911/1915/1917 synthase
MKQNDLLKEISILYEDADIAVINKPAGLIVHPDGRTEEPAVTDWILKKFPATKGVGEPLSLSDGAVIDRPGIVHRIDRETSGVLVVAKNQLAHAFLKRQFQDGTVRKVYLAFVYGEVKNDDGVIDRPIARSKKDFRLWSAGRGAKGKEREAVTRYRVLARRDGVSLVEVIPQTGRTHQIRVHFKAINYPVLCDKLYAPKRPCLLGFSRVALHAFSVEFKTPSGETVKSEAPLPDDFKKALLEIERS